MSVVAHWESFYVIIGSSAAALTGLQFVVIVLGSEVGAVAGMPATRAFGTPTVVHFCAVLLISAIASSPWPSLGGAAIALGLCGVAGVIYALIVLGHARRQTLYEPVWEDWLWHCVFPFAAYAALLLASLALPRHAEPALFVIGGSALLLLFTGIHNAWDAVTWMAHQASARQREEPAPPPTPAEPPRTQAGAEPGR